MLQYLTVPQTGTTRALFVTIGALGLSADAAVAAGLPDTVRLVGVARDFHGSHPDFDVTPAGGFGHYAGNVALSLGPDGRPTFNGTGFRVDSQWQDDEARSIAPHLFGGWGAGAVLVGGAPSISPLATEDTWDSTIGPYGGPNVGPAPNYAAGATMPTVVPPGGMGTSVGALLFKDPGVSVMSGDVRCSSLSIRDDHRLQIDGSVRILCDGDFTMRDGGTIELLAGASLELYVLGDVEIVDSTINDGFFEPSRFALYHLGAGTVRIVDGAEVYGTVVSPGGTVNLADGANFYGAVVAADLDVGDAAGLHIDARAAYDQCGNRFDDAAGLAGLASSGGISSPASFEQWFRDVPGVNISIRHAITLVRGIDDLYEFESTDFFPLDDRLFGNEGEAHNYYFTYTINAQFTYDACADQFLEFEGNDDAWALVDGKLAMDLGGIAPATDQTIDFDRLGLVDGERVSLRFFYAHRQGTFANFRLRTNVVFETPAPIAVSALFD